MKEFGEGDSILAKLHEYDDIAVADLPPREVRTVLFYLLYALESFDYQVSLESIIDNFHRGYGIKIGSQSEIASKARGIIEERQALDAEMMPLFSNWRLERLGLCTRLILRLALWELKHTDIHSSIIINEAVELAKCFAETDAYKFVNGILDEWVKRNSTIHLSEPARPE